MGVNVVNVLHPMCRDSNITTSGDPSSVAFPRSNIDSIRLNDGRVS